MTDRQIKFRAWDSKNKRMDYNPCDGEYGTECTPLNSVIKGCQEEGQILQQFTGLYDKSGNEIFEGDIFEGGGLVAFRDGAFRGIYTDSQGNIEEPWEDELCLRCSSEVVIGSIFENSKLLEEA
jgi:hypothetical protein